MSTIPFLKNRQIGSELRSSSTLNLDSVISRLVCYKKDIFTVQGEETEVPPFACKFRRDAQRDLLAVCNEDGYILLYDTLKREEPLIKTFSAHRNAILDICWLPDKCQLITGSGDNVALLWDITQCKAICAFKCHTASIKSVDVCHEQSAVFATGSRDGNINVWDTRVPLVSLNSKPVISISQAHCRKNTVLKGKGKKSLQKDPISSVSAVAFQDSNNLASAGVADGVVKIWDLRRTYVSNSKYLPSPRYRMDYSESGNTGHGCSSLVFDSHYKTLYACSTSHKILKFDCHSYVKEAVTYEGFQCSTYFVKLDLSSDNQYLLCGSSDEKAYIWKTSKPGLPIAQLAAHSAEVTSVTWSPYTITKLVTCGDDSKVAIWKVGSELDRESRNTNTTSINENIHAISEPYSESPKNSISSSVLQITVQSSITVSRPAAQKSPGESTKTPNKPSVKVITSFFLPLTPVVQTLSNDSESQIKGNNSSSLTSNSPNKNQINGNSSPSLTSKSPNKNHSENRVNGNNSPSLTSKSPNKILAADSSSSVLTPCNHVNKTAHMHQSPDGNSVAKTSPELKSSPTQKNGICFPSSSTSVQNKENASIDISPETVNNTCQSKRKVATRHSTPIVKRRRIESAKKTKRPVKRDKNTIPGKTIMNYFSVVLSPPNTE